jgi:hypothetical protein
MNLRDFWAAEAAKLRDTSELLDTSALLDKNGLNGTPASKNQEVLVKKCEEKLGTAALFEIKSLASEAILMIYLENSSNKRGSFLKNLDTRVQKIDKEGSPQESNETNETAKKALKIGWKDWQIRFDTDDTSADNAANADAARRERANKAARRAEFVKMLYDGFSGQSVEEIVQNVTRLKKGYTDEFTDYQKYDIYWLDKTKDPFKKSIKSFFQASIWNDAKAILDSLFMFIDEQAEIVNRYDSIYQTTDFLKALELNPYTLFDPAEIKAINMQKTGDFTNTSIAGVTATPKKGIPKGSIKASYIGIAQLGIDDSVKGAKEMATRLYNNKKITIKVYNDWKNFMPDNRTQAVVLFALYLIEVERIIIAQIGADTKNGANNILKWQNAGAEKKKFLICSFNTDPGVGVATLLQELPKQEALIFSTKIVTIMAQKAKDKAPAAQKESKYKEVMNYTFNIIERLKGY